MKQILYPQGGVPVAPIQQVLGWRNDFVRQAAKGFGAAIVAASVGFVPTPQPTPVNPKTEQPQRIERPKIQPQERFVPVIAAQFNVAWKGYDADRRPLPNRQAFDVNLPSVSAQFFTAWRSQDAPRLQTSTRFVPETIPLTPFPQFSVAWRGGELNQRLTLALQVPEGNYSFFQEQRLFGWYHGEDARRLIGFYRAPFLIEPSFFEVQVPIDVFVDVFRKKKRKPQPDLIEEEIARKKKLRADLELALYGPPVQFTFTPETAPVAKPIDAAALAQLVNMLEQQRLDAIRAQAEADEEDDLEIILREL